MEDGCRVPAERLQLNCAPGSDGPGIYFIFLEEAISLGDFELDKNRLIYIGKSESTIGARNHAKYRSSSRSTLRRSLGAILFPDSDVFPRTSKEKVTPKAIQNYRFSEETEKELSKWMLEYLTYGYLIVKKGRKEIREQERTCIEKWNPTLNLDHSSNRQKKKLEELRQRCRAKAGRKLAL